MKILRSVGYALARRLYPPHWGLKFLGRRSVIMRPYRVEGRGYISIGNDTIISAGGWLSVFPEHPGSIIGIEIGNHVRIGPGVMVTSINRVEIGSGTLFSRDVFVSDHTHSAEPNGVPPHRQRLRFKGDVKIGENCFIGIRAVIMPGVVLGNCCIVGANAVVTKSFPARSILAGVPARLIGHNTWSGE